MVATAGGRWFKKNNVPSFLDSAMIDLLYTCFLLLAETTGLFPINTDEPFQLELWGKPPEYLNELLKALSWKQRELFWNDVSEAQSYPPWNFLCRLVQ